MKRIVFERFDWFSILKYDFENQYFGGFGGWVADFSKRYEKKFRCIFDAQTKIQTLNWLNKVGLKEDLFKPRQKIIEVDLQRRNEKKLLDFIEKKFVIDLMKARKEHVSSKPKSFY